MRPPDVNGWIAEVKAGPEASGVGIMLAHQGIVRGTTRSGEPGSGMLLEADRARLEEVLAETRTWPGVIAVRAWVNEGPLGVGDDIMKVLVAGDIRENVFGALQRLVSLIKNEVVSEMEMREHSAS
jgi:molybdopterin synthase catalytic subunit